MHRRSVRRMAGFGFASDSVHAARPNNILMLLRRRMSEVEFNKWYRAGTRSLQSNCRALRNVAYRIADMKPAVIVIGLPIRFLGKQCVRRCKKCLREQDAKEITDAVKNALGGHPLRGDYRAQSRLRLI